MHFKVSHLVTVLSIVTLSNSCTSALYFPTETEALKSHSSVSELTEGRALYINNCGSCHTLYLPQHLTKEEWAKDVKRMQPKAKISDQETELILKYVTASCKE